jgi:hypothetical protein
MVVGMDEINLELKSSGRGERSALVSAGAGD